MKHATLREHAARRCKTRIARCRRIRSSCHRFMTRCAKRMLEFKDWPAEDIRSIEAPTLVMIGDADNVRPEHAVEMFRLLPHAQLAVLPGGHGAYIGEVICRKVRGFAGAVRRCRVPPQKGEQTP